MYQFAFSLLETLLNKSMGFFARFLSTERLFLGMTVICVNAWILDRMGILTDPRITVASALALSAMFAVIATRILSGTTRDLAKQGGHKVPSWLDHPGDER